MLGRNGNAHMNVIGHDMTFNDLAFLLACQFAEDRSEFGTHVPKQFLAASLGHKHHVVLAIPLRVGQALIIVVHKVLLWFRLIKPPEENLLPERSKLFKSHWSNQWLTLWDLQLGGFSSCHARQNADIESNLR